MAELVERTNWRRQEKTESVDKWKAKVYEIHNVVFSFQSWKVAGGDSNVAGSEQVLPLELNEDDDSFLIAENPSFGFSLLLIREDIVAFFREEGEWVTVPRKSVGVPSITTPPQRSVSMVALLFLVWLS